MKYADMTAVGANMLPKHNFLSVISKDKISIYHCQSPLAVEESSEISRLIKEYVKSETVRFEVIKDYNAICNK